MCYKCEIITNSYMLLCLLRYNIDMLLLIGVCYFIYIYIYIYVCVCVCGVWCVTLGLQRNAY